MNCRSEYSMTLPYANDCDYTNNAWECDAKDYAFSRQYYGFQFYDVFQSHIIDTIKFRNCKNSPHSGQTCIRSGACEAAPWILLSHSDEFVPEIMQATKNVSYENIDFDNLIHFSTEKDDAGGITVSGRLQNWLDVDGSVLTGTPTVKNTIIGSDWSGNAWWNFHADCIHDEANEVYACPSNNELSHDITSFKLHFNDNYDLVPNTYCRNGNYEGNVMDCPVVGTVVHFGESSTDNGLEIAYNAK